MSPFVVSLYPLFHDVLNITYEDMETFGYPLGTGGDYDFGGEAVKFARAKKQEFQKRLDNLDADLADLEDDDD
jgi:hypothetical protein